MDIPEIDFSELPENSETKYIIRNVITIIEYIDQHHEITKYPEEQYHDIMFDKFSIFADKYFKFFELILEDDMDFDTLYAILKVKAGIELKKITSTQGDKIIGEVLAQKFLYPTLGFTKQIDKVQGNNISSRESNSNEHEVKLNRKERRKIQKQNKK